MITINDIQKVSGFRDQKDRLFPEFRRQVYEYLKYHLSNVMTDADLDIIVKLITEIFSVKIFEKAEGGQANGIQ